MCSFQNKLTGFCPYLLTLILYLRLCSAATRYYNFTLAESYLAQDGVYKAIKTINGISPGPTIEADENDWISIKVINNLQVAASIHYHGILQLGTPWSDGVPGITQRPIESGEEYTYLFQVKDQCGAFWYHSHYRGYSSDGLYGLIYVRPSVRRERPYMLITNSTEDLQLMFDLESVPATLIADDTFHEVTDAVFLRMFEHGIDPLCIRSILVNGKGRVMCHAPRTFRRLASKNPFLMQIPEFDSMGCVRDPALIEFHGKTIDHERLNAPGYSAQCQPTTSDLHLHYTEGRDWQYINVLNAGGQNTKALSIDDHPFYLVAVDGVFVYPKLYHSLLIPVGSRCTILFETKPENHEDISKPFVFRFAASHTPQYIEGRALLVYGSQGSDPRSFTEIAKTDYVNGRRFQDLDGRLISKADHACWSHQTTPFEKETTLKPGDADITHSLFLQMFDIVQFSMFENRAKLPEDFETSPPLLDQWYEKRIADKSAYRKAAEVILSPQVLPGQTVDFIVNNNKHINHPIHLHGHYMFLLSYSTHENFPFKTVLEGTQKNCTTLNFKNPPLLDVILVPVGGHAVLRIVADNPGIWLLHCHNVGHLMGGMGAIFMETPELIPERPLMEDALPG